MKVYRYRCPTCGYESTNFPSDLEAQVAKNNHLEMHRAFAPTTPVSPDDAWKKQETVWV
jgi:hypothetical protein